MKVKYASMLVILLVVVLLSFPIKSFAEAWDLKELDTNRVYSMIDWYDDSMLIMNIALNPENYILEVSGSFYKVNEIIAVMNADDTLSIEEAVSSLNPVDNGDPGAKVFQVIAIY